MDPLLFSASAHPEISIDGNKLYEDFLKRVIKLLQASRIEGDQAWRAAKKLVHFPEIPGTCLGYGSANIRGSGFGDHLSTQILHTAKEILAFGIEDPAIFPLLALIEEGIGADRISDMATNIILGALVKFNKRILQELNIPTAVFNINGIEADFIANPFQKKPTPIILLPSDILRELPIAKSWKEISSAAYKNKRLRDRVNEHIGKIWEFSIKSKEEKKEFKKLLLSGKESLLSIIDSIDAVPKTHYDVLSDPSRIIMWPDIGNKIAGDNPIYFEKIKEQNIESLYKVVDELVSTFKHLVENCGLNKELYKDNHSPFNEKTAQNIFYSTCYHWCKNSGVDINPEANAGNGPVDFKFSVGCDAIVLVELKLSTNRNIVRGYETQLEIYKTAEHAKKAIYLIIDVNGKGNYMDTLISIKNKRSRNGLPVSDIEYIDATLKPSPSKRRS